jgi:cell division transport system permease protein
MSINIGYFARESWTNFRRNWVMSLGAVITIYLSLLLVGVFLVTGIVINSIVKSVEDKVTIQVFLKDGASTEDVDALQKELLADPLVATVDYTSKTEAKKKFEESMATSPEMIDQLEGNPFPASLDLALHDPSKVKEMADKILVNDRFIAVAERPETPNKSVKYGEGVVEKLFAFTRVIRLIEIAFVVMLAIVSLIFINNTIRLAIYARRKEIGIMRLVGASNWFIRAPFMLEGVMQAMIGAALAILSLLALQSLVLPRIAEALPFLAVSLSSTAMTQIAIVLVVGGVFIGLLGSSLAMRRYLKV